MTATIAPWERELLLPLMKRVAVEVFGENPHAVDAPGSADNTGVDEITAPGTSKP